ncbi:TauD/TfdA dioxygenase family protein [Burkholderia sp. 22PA0106]|uniref:TauD/TfdA dioxygenase family protein n=1 Tax=Burkholderia sp. 22PA0106 TaxID=3237371 RepID=UPI0039C1972D
MIRDGLAAEFGLALSRAEFAGIAPARLRTLLHRHGFVLVRDIEFDRPAFRRCFEQFGEVVHYLADPQADGYARSDVLELAGQPGRGVAGRGQLPLHADGDRQRFVVDHVFLYAAQVGGQGEGGRTVLCHHRVANQALPAHLKSILTGRVHSVRFSNTHADAPDAQPGDWIPVPVFPRTGSAEPMMIYFPFDDAGQAFWECRVDGLDAVASREYFAELAAFYRQARYAYRHDWAPHQLLIFDNRTLLHEREPYGHGQAHRTLWRGLTRERTAPAAPRHDHDSVPR